MLKYLKHDIWEMDLDSLPPLKKGWISFLRIAYLTLQGFTKNQIQPGASGLVYYTLLTIVPIISLLLWIAHGFNYEEKIEAWLLKQFPDQEEIYNRLFEFVNNSLQEIKGGLIASLGILLFLWAMVKILLKLKVAMNRTWEVTKKKKLGWQLTHYAALIVLIPLIIFAASGLPEILTTMITYITHGDPLLEQVAKGINLLLEVVPFILMCLLCTFMYKLVPSTKVHFVPALIAGLFTGVVYELIQSLYVYFQIGVSRYNAIYGTFAAFPLFLIWIHLSWIILLTGSKLTFAIQNRNSIEHPQNKI